MSTTNLAIVQFAFQKVNIIADGETPSPEQGQTGLTVLNDVLADEAEDGVNLGWYPQTNLAADAPLQDSDVNGVKLRLTRSLAAHYGVSLSPELASEIEDAWARITKRTRPLAGEANLSELPRASGGPFGCGGYW
jgi:hypothetical protein